MSDKFFILSNLTCNNSDLYTDKICVTNQFEEHEIYITLTPEKIEIEKIKISNKEISYVSLTWDDIEELI